MMPKSLEIFMLSIFIFLKTQLRQSSRFVPSRKHPVTASGRLRTLKSNNIHRIDIVALFAAISLGRYPFSTLHAKHRIGGIIEVALVVKRDLTSQTFVFQIVQGLI